MSEAKLSLQRAQQNYEDGDLLWTTVVIYYAEYYALYSFLQRIGLKCENHSCTILAAEFLLGKDKTRTIRQHMGKRIDAQYYMRIGKQEQVRQMLDQAKEFIAGYDELVSNLYEKEIGAYSARIKIIAKKEHTG